VVRHVEIFDRSVLGSVWSVKDRSRFLAERSQSATFVWATAQGKSADDVRTERESAMLEPATWLIASRAPAGVLRAHVLDRRPLPRNELQRLGHVLADLCPHLTFNTAGGPFPPRLEETPGQGCEGYASEPNDVTRSPTAGGQQKPYLLPAPCQPPLEAQRTISGRDVLLVPSRRPRNPLGMTIGRLTCPPRRAVSEGLQP
jgi:hypothetical protein